MTTTRTSAHSLSIIGAATWTASQCSCGWQSATHNHHYPRLSAELQIDAMRDAETAAVEEGQEHLCDRD